MMILTLVSLYGCTEDAPKSTVPTESSETTPSSDEDTAVVDTGDTDGTGGSDDGGPGADGSGGGAGDGGQGDGGAGDGGAGDGGAGDGGDDGDDTGDAPAGALDHDEDGFTEDQDCDDDDPSVSPAAPDAACDGFDDDCDGLADDEFDQDVYEPNDLISTDLGTPTDGTVEELEHAFTFPADDVDVYAFVANDWTEPWELFEDEFVVEVGLAVDPGPLQLEVQLLRYHEGTAAWEVLASDLAAGGDDVTLHFEGSLWDDDSGVYGLAVVPLDSEAYDCGSGYAAWVYRNH